MRTRGGAELAERARRIPVGVDRGARAMRPPSTSTMAMALGIAGVVFLVLLITVTVQLPWLVRFDHAVASAASALLRGHPTPIHAVAIVRWVVSPPVGVGVAWLVAAWLARRRARRLAAWLAVTPVLTWALVLLLRSLVDRPELDTALIVAGTGFPAAYAAVSVATIGALLIVAVLSWPTWQWYSRTLATVALVLAAGFQLLLGLHTPTDILGGWLLGLGVLGATCLSFGVSDARAVGRRAAADEAGRPLVACIYNPIKQVSAADLRALVAEAAARHGFAPPLFLETERDDPGRSMARRAVDAGASLVLAAGGDGTVRTVCAELAETDVPLGVIASGTGNLLARNLELPLEQPEAIHVAFTGRDRVIDLLEAHGDDLPTQTFAVMAGVGLDAAASQVDDRLKRNVGWVAYVVAGVRHFSLPAITVAISVDDAPPETFRARSVMIGNVGQLTGGFELLPDASPDDGLLNVVVVGATTLLDWSRVGVATLTRRHRGDEKLTYLQGASVRIWVQDEEPVPRELDGDVIEPGRHLHARVVPATLVVRVP